jgi:hypothetical protein|tara:strand:- start:373 stop:594 length:222 start_codon:yes stop_codon:yes gene_type:complete
LEDLDLEGCEGAELSSFDIIDQECNGSDLMDDFVDPNKVSGKSEENRPMEEGEDRESGQILDSDQQKLVRKTV